MCEGPSQSDPFVQAVGRFVDAKGFLPARAGVVAGVSGGADSVAMLAALRELARQPRRDYRLTVAHLNHGLRPDAAEDARFVADLAGRWDLPCLIESCDVAAEARRLGQAVEQAARMVRYRFLRAAAEKVSAGWVAVGHHADDNVETILYRVVRGTHLRGLAGMPAARTLEGGPVILVRPLLGATRRQIEAFCRRRGLTWRTDPTNVDVRFRRNFIRHKLLPLLRSELNCRTDEALLRLASSSGQVEAFLAAQADAAMQRCRIEAGSTRVVLSRPALAAEAPIICAYVLRGALETVGAPMRAVGAGRFDDLLALLADAGPAGVCLPGDVHVRREGEEVVIERRPERPSAAAIAAIPCPGRTALGDGGEVFCEYRPFDGAEFEAHRAANPAGVELLDADQIRGGLTIRPRRNGDAFVPLGAPGRRTVSDFLTDLKLPRRRRDCVRCICDELGVVYLAPLRIDDRVKITKATRRVLRIEVRCPQA